MKPLNERFTQTPRKDRLRPSSPGCSVVVVVVVVVGVMVLALGVVVPWKGP